MDHDELQRLLRQRPFQPMRVYVSDGRVYDIRYPRTSLLVPKFIKIGILEEGHTASNPRVHHGEYVRFDQIVRIELLPAEPPQVAEGA